MNRLLPRVLLAAIAAVGTPAMALAAGNTLSGASVSPTAGTITTTFTFNVDYASDQGVAATSVWAEVAGTTVGLALVSGSDDDGSFSGSSSLPAGSWSVTFRADAVQGLDPTLVGPTVTVTDPSATASPAPTPTPAPTPRPTRSPRPTPAPTPRPTAAPTLRPTTPPTSGPVPPAPILPPGQSPAPGATTLPAPPASSAASASSDAQPSGRPSAAGVPASSATPFPREPDSTEDATGLGIPWLFVGSGMSAIGAAILAGQWARRRRHRPARL